MPIQKYDILIDQEKKSLFKLMSTEQNQKNEQTTLTATM